jgi:heat shock protein HslJ
MKTMRQLLFMGIIACAFSCTTTRDSQVSFKGSWELAVFPYTQRNFSDVFGERKPQINFKTGGKLTGNTGCNQMSGGYSVTKESLTFAQNLITTRMACPGYDETIFINALQGVNRYLIDGSQLRLMKDSTVLMVFAKR